MTKWERVKAAIRGEEVDRIPICLWKHYHLQDRAPGRLAEATLALCRQFDLDLVKLMPSGLYMVQDWGAAIHFGRDDDTAPLAVAPAVAGPDGWLDLPRLDPNNGALRRELEMIRQVARGLDGSAPFLMTIFSPLTIAYKLCGDKVSGDRVIQDLRQSPRQLHAGLAVIRDVLMDYVDACVEAGASGFFFATQMANYDALTRQEYVEFGVDYDLPVLEQLQQRARITMLHICRQNLMFDLVAGYPVDIINWADREGGPSLAEARQITDKALAGGLALETLLHGSVGDMKAEVRDAIGQVDGRGFLLAPACVIPGPTPDANLEAVRQAVAKEM